MYGRTRNVVCEGLIGDVMIWTDWNIEIGKTRLLVLDGDGYMLMVRPWSTQDYYASYGCANNSIDVG